MHFRPDAAAPLYQQLYRHLQAAILSGELKGGLRLPSTRALAEELSVSRNTVLNAYEQLLAEGYVESLAGSGTFVARVLPEQLLTPAERAHASQRRLGVVGTGRRTGVVGAGAAQQQAPGAASAPRFAERARQVLAAPRFSADVPTGQAGQPRPFRFGMPALDAFPLALWSQLVARRARRLSTNALTYQDEGGYRPLREAIAAHVTVSRRVRCTPEQIVVVSGSQGALDLAARMLIDPGEAAWVEDPGYFGARGALLGAEARLVPVPVDAEGLMVEAGVARAPEARLAYVTPSHQFPLGATLSLGRRLALLAWAERAGAYILEDDYDSEYRYSGRPLAALQGLDEAERVIYIGTFSKVLFPALRIGYLILPQALVEPFQAVRALIDIHTPLLEQAVLADFIAEGHFTRHLRRMRRLYAERRDALLRAARGLPLEIESPEAGIHCVAWLPEGIDELALRRAAEAEGLVLWTVSRFALEAVGRKGLVLGFAEYDEATIREGMRKLGEAIQRVWRV
jgi:GntR family transcriptional regulator/MocR family aminotransferase